MTEDRPPGEQNDPAVGTASPGSEIRLVAPLAEDGEEGGDPVCWAHLVCDECGAVTTEGHRDGCSRQRLTPGAGR
jgi:hypothetical protein